MGQDRRWMGPHWPLWAMVLIVLFVFAARIQIVDIPLERDEGEYAYAAQLLLQGIPPYTKAYNMKMPGIYYAYGLMIAVAGATHTGIHVGLIAINIASCVLLFLLVRRLFDSKTGVFAAAAYAVLSVSPAVLGFSANAEHFVVAFALGGLLLLLRATDSKSLWGFLGSGVLLGMAVTMKQHGAAFGIFGAGLVLTYGLKNDASIWRDTLLRLLLFAAGLVIPYGIICIILWSQGAFDKFWFWTTSYAWQYVNRIPVEHAPIVFFRAVSAVIQPSSLMWLLAIVGVSSIFWDRKAELRRSFLLCFVVASFVSICPGFYFRSHYFILVLPVVSLCAGLATVSLSRTLLSPGSRGFRFGAQAIPVAVFLVACLQPLYMQRTFFLEKDAGTAAKIAYGTSPFSESLRIAEYISQRTSPDDTIAVLGSEPQIYFYAKRKSATGYVYMYPLMENQPFAMDMLLEMTEEIESNSPKFLVFVHVYDSWLWTPYVWKSFLRWFGDFARDHYRLVGFVEIYPGKTATYRWDGTRPEGTPDPPLWIEVLQRKN